MIKQWIEALRSGEYRQARGTLRTQDGRFCCLGVACEISGIDKWEFNGNSYSYDHNYSGMSARVCDHIGFPLSGQGRLIQMNDNQGATFQEIADYLETLCIEKT